VVRIAPKPGDLTWCRGRFPTVKGDISVEWRRPEGGGFELRVDVPEPMRVHAILPVYGGADRLTVSGGEAERVERSEERVEVWLEKGGVYELRLTE